MLFSVVQGRLSSQINQNYGSTASSSSETTPLVTRKNKTKSSSFAAILLSVLVILVTVHIVVMRCLDLPVDIHESIRSRGP
jgi:hypothetical protein